MLLVLGIILKVTSTTENQDAVFQRLVLCFETLFEFSEINRHDLVMSKMFKNEVYYLISVAPTHMGCLQIFWGAAMLAIRLRDSMILRDLLD